MRTIEPPAWMYTGALENHPELVDQLGWIAPLWGNSGEVLARVRSPWELSEVLAAAGLLFPEIRHSAGNIPRDGSWLTKTYAGASGSGVREWGEERGARSEDERGTLACYQRKIDGVPCAAVFVAVNGETKLLGVTRQLIGEPWLGAHGFQYAGSIGPWAISDVTRSTIEQIGSAIADRFELIGLFGVDFILDGDNVWTLEVNPRYTASVEIVERFSGISAIAAHVKACDGQLPKPHQSYPKSIFPMCGKAILFAKRELIISDEFAGWSLMESARLPWPTVADVSPAGTAIETDRPILSIFAEAATPAEVKQQLRDRVAEIERRLYAIQ
jgi:predicted ATP-grasp superfamily ATP-dependent carboligase